MGGRTRAEAVEVLFGLLQQAVSSVTPEVLVGRADAPAPALHTMTFGAGVVRLARRSDLGLLVRHGYRLAESADGVGRWEAVTMNYAYRLLDRGENPLLSFHWHPESRRYRDPTSPSRSRSDGSH